MKKIIEVRFLIPAKLMKQYVLFFVHSWFCSHMDV